MEDPNFLNDLKQEQDSSFVNNDPETTVLSEKKSKEPFDEHPLKQHSKRWIVITAAVAAVAIIGSMSFFLFWNSTKTEPVEQAVVEEKAVPDDYVPPQYNDNLDAAIEMLKIVDL